MSMSSPHPSMRPHAEKYIHEDPMLVPLLDTLHQAGKKVFLATNSLWVGGLLFIIFIFILLFLVDRSTYLGGRTRASSAGWNWGSAAGGCGGKGLAQKPSILLRQSTAGSRCRRLPPLPAPRLDLNSVTLHSKL